MLKLDSLGHCRFLFRYIQAPNKRNANIKVLCRKLLHLEECFAISRHCYLPERFISFICYLFFYLLLWIGVLLGSYFKLKGIDVSVYLVSVCLKVTTQHLPKSMNWLVKQIQITFSQLFCCFFLWGGFWLEIEMCLLLISRNFKRLCARIEKCDY